MTTPIRIFYHLTQIHDWYDITKFIFDKMSDSGLLADCEKVYVGALGDESELPKLKELLSHYPKTELRGHSTDKDFYEGFTMRWIKEDADRLPKFYALYCHSKSVTYPVGGGTDHRGNVRTANDKVFEIWWRDYMVNEVITNWRTGYAALSMPDIGYQVYGCRGIPSNLSASLYSHFSGNYFMISSEYVKCLPRIVDYRELEDRTIEGQIHFHYEEIKRLCSQEAVATHSVMLPEMWPYFRQPLMYVACNAFTQGFTFQKTFEETIKDGYPIEEYRTRNIK